MGACDFVNRGSGRTAKEAFTALTEQSRYENGHGGYTGTIAEKHDFVMITPRSTDPSKLIDEAYERVDEMDKWGPAGCFPAGPGEWIFFGMASS